MFRFSSQSHLQAVVSSFGDVKVSSVCYTPSAYLYGSSSHFYIWDLSSLSDDDLFRLMFTKADTEKHGLIYSVLITKNNEKV
jgi:hypothetical protein